MRGNTGTQVFLFVDHDVAHPAHVDLKALLALDFSSSARALAVNLFVCQQPFYADRNLRQH